MDTPRRAEEWSCLSDWGIKRSSFTWRRSRVREASEVVCREAAQSGKITGTQISLMAGKNIFVVCKKKKKKKPICNCTASEKCFLCVSIHVSLSVIKTAWPQRIQNRMQNHGNPANRREKRAIYKKKQTKKRTIGSYECCGTIFCNDTKWHKINLNQMLQRGECSGEKKGIAQKPKVMWPHV